MKNTLNQIYLALFLAFISQGIHAQFDDIYYDPDKDEPSLYSGQKKDTHWEKDDYTTEKGQSVKDDQEGVYDDTYSEWEDQDYYYTSRIKRFHRPYHGFDFYSPCYVDFYFYDNYDYDPWFYDRDIYSTRWYYYDSYGWNRWNSYRYYYRPYWSYWDWCVGWNSYPYANRFGYWPYGYYSYNPYFNSHHGGYYDRYWDHGSNNPKGHYYGSRRFGATQTSNRGPVRLYNADPEILKTLPGKSREERPQRETGRRPIRSVEGDRAGEDHNGKQEKSDQPRPKPRLFSGESGYEPQSPESGFPGRSPRPEQGRVRQEMPEQQNNFDEREKRSWFSPHRSIRPDADPKRDPATERSFAPGNEIFRQDRESTRSRESKGFLGKILGGHEGSDKGTRSSGNSEKSGNSKSNDGGRRSPR